MLHLSKEAALGKETLGLVLVRGYLQGDGSDVGIIREIPVAEDLGEESIQGDKGRELLENLRQGNVSKRSDRHGGGLLSLG